MCDLDLRLNSFIKRFDINFGDFPKLHMFIFSKKYSAFIITSDNFLELITSDIIYNKVITFHMTTDTKRGNILIAFELSDDYELSRISTAKML